MDADKLKAFHQVALTGSFTKASGKLFLSQPAVSQKVQALENSLGVTLFDRSGKTVHLTREGEILLSYTDRLFALHDEIDSLFRDMTDLNRGRIAIGATAVMGIYFMTRIIGRFNRKYPGIEIDLRMGNSLSVVNLILEGEVDIGFTGWAIDHSSLERILIHTEPLFIVSSPDNPLTRKKTVLIDDLRSTPFIWREKGTQTRVLVKEWFEVNVGKDYPKQSIELENIEAAKRAVGEGCGITIAPERAVRREIDAGLLRRIYLDDFDISVDYHLTFKKNKIFSRAAEAFLELLLELRLLNHVNNLQDWKMGTSLWGKEGGRAESRRGDTETR
jgi:DNA-binding transcriptional LysR family regulator